VSTDEVAHYFHLDDEDRDDFHLPSQLRSQASPRDPERLRGPIGFQTNCRNSA
jgi:hypothetical protein